MKEQTYRCPMHPEITQKEKGFCRICGMALFSGNSGENHHHESVSSYTPLIIIIGFITLISLVLVLANRGETFFLEMFMRVFMAGFFLVFSGFKLLDLRGFAEGYATYDLLAKRVFTYGYIYPFLELLLGLSYATNFQPFFTNVATIILMGFSELGVLRAMQKKQKIQCACLGTFLKVPLTKITLIEDFGMVIMAFIMLQII